MRPHERLAVGHGQVGAEDGVAQLAVLLAGHHRVDGGDADVAALPGGDGGVHPFDGPLVVGQRERDAEDLDAGRRHGSLRERGALGGVGRGGCRRVGGHGPRGRGYDTHNADGAPKFRGTRTCIGCPSVPRALVTGVSGQDGSYLAALLADRGYEVVGLVREPGESLPDGVSALTGDLLEPATLRAAVARRPARRALPPRRPDLRPRLVGGPDRDGGRDRHRDRDAAGGGARGRPGHARVGLDLQRGLRRRGREPADRAQPDAPAHALRRGEARRARPRGRDARALGALRLLGADLQPRVAAASRAVPHAQGHARRRRDQARPRARARARRPRRGARLVARRRRRARRVAGAAGRRARRLRDRLGRRAHRARLRRRRLRRARPRLGGLRARRPRLRPRARAGGAGGRPDARPRAPGLDAGALLRGPRGRDGGRRPGGPARARLPPAPWTTPS